MVRIMAGQGFFRTRNPSSPSATGLPSSFTTSAEMPGSGFVPEPGFSGIAGIGAMMKAPVSVCHHVSMIGHFSLPMFL
jgi:hypothetical protein